MLNYTSNSEDFRTGVLNSSAEEITGAYHTGLWRNQATKDVEPIKAQNLQDDLVHLYNVLDRKVFFLQMMKNLDTEKNIIDLMWGMLQIEL